MSTPAAATRARTHRSAPATSIGEPQSTTVAFLLNALNSFVRLSSAAATKTSVVSGSGFSMRARSSSSALAAASLSRLGASSASAWATMTTRRGAIIGSVRPASTIDATPSAILSPVVISPA